MEFIIVKLCVNMNCVSDCNQAQPVGLYLCPTTDVLLSSTLSSPGSFLPGLALLFTFSGVTVTKAWVISHLPRHKNQEEKWIKSRYFIRVHQSEDSESLDVGSD